MSNAIAMECAAENIRVNSVHPGVIWSDTQQIAIRDNPDQYEAINASIPMQRVGEPDDIAAMIAFLASDDASMSRAVSLSAMGADGSVKQ